MDAKTFGAFLARIRKARGLTQAGLAEQLHVTDKAVSRWERGIGLPDINTLEPLAAYPEQWEPAGRRLASLLGVFPIVCRDRISLAGALEQL